VAIGDASDCVAENLDRRLGYVLIVVSRAGFEQRIITLLNNSVRLGSFISSTRFSAAKFGLCAG